MRDPIECIVPPLGTEIDSCVRSSDTPNVERMQLLQRSERGGARAGEALVVDAVGDEQPRITIAEDREPELEARAPAAQRAEVRDRVAQPGIVNVEGPEMRDSRIAGSV